MTAAVLPRSSLIQRLLVVHAGEDAVFDEPFANLPQWFEPGDVLVVNDAATLPASVPMQLHGVPGELRLVGAPEHGWVVLFGPGSWRQATEDRAAPAYVAVGDVVEVADRRLAVLEVSTISPRLVRLALTLDDVLVHGRPVQYSYVPRRLRLDEVQTPYSTRPWATEMPSAGRVLTPHLLQSLRDRGVQVVSLTHGAGLSATGDVDLDASLPLPERYEVPQATWAAVSGAQRVVAVGTSVVRALESAVRGPLAGVTDLKIGPDTQLGVVDALLSGMHEPGESHFRMMAAFVDLDRLRRAVQHAEQEGYSNHEFGDSTLLFRDR
jgi:S-adenosylmethionine:tRNA ribosyltransferase-isomerase